jgi:hypothetical protein
MMLKRLSVAALGLAFAGCGLLPPVTLNNPVGLNGKQVAVALDQEPALMGARLVTANGMTGAMGGGSVEATFADVSSVGTNPTTFDLNLPLDPKVTITADIQPDTVTLSDISFDLSLSDAAHEAVTVNLPYSGTVTLTRQEDGSYLASTAATAAWAFVGSLPSATVASAVEVITQGGENTATGTVHFTADTLEPGDAINVTFQDTTGTISFK